MKWLHTNHQQLHANMKRQECFQQCSTWVLVLYKPLQTQLHTLHSHLLNIETACTIKIQQVSCNSVTTITRLYLYALCHHPRAHLTQFGVWWGGELVLHLVKGAQATEMFVRHALHGEVCYTLVLKRLPSWTFVNFYEFVLVLVVLYCCFGTDTYRFVSSAITYYIILLSLWEHIGDSFSFSNLSFSFLLTTRGQRATISLFSPDNTSTSSTNDQFYTIP